MKLSEVYSASRIIQNLLDLKMEASLSYKILSLASQMNEDLKIIERVRDSFLKGKDSDAENRFIDFLTNEDSSVEYKKINLKYIENSSLHLSPTELRLLLPFMEES